MSSARAAKSSGEGVSRVTLRIAFDCDGCIADLDSALEAICVRLFGEAPRPSKAEAGNDGAVPGERAGGDPSAERPDPQASDAEGPTAEEVQAEPQRFRTLTRRQQHDLWDVVHKTENFWETLKETEPGAIARLAQIARERRWEVIFITQRPASAGDTTQLQTQRWLVEHGYDLPSVYVIKGTRGKVAEALSLDVVVDDRPEHCLDVKLESRARAILVCSGDPASLPPNARRLGIEPVTGIHACLDLLTEERPSKPGLLSKLKKLVGA
jgi:hypothetical protein